MWLALSRTQFVSPDGFLSGMMAATGMASEGLHLLPREIPSARPSHRWHLCDSNKQPGFIPMRSLNTGVLRQSLRSCPSERVLYRNTICSFEDKEAKMSVYKKYV